jgi:hypothetical protein
MVTGVSQQQGEDFADGGFAGAGLGQRQVRLDLVPVVRVATRMPFRPRSTPSIVTADRRAALPRETVARAGIG